MSFYETHILPRILDWAMRHGPFLEYREHLVPTAEERVLEIGIAQDTTCRSIRDELMTSS
jgi:hypothetical protein